MGKNILHTLKESSFLIIGELIVSLLVIAVYLILGLSFGESKIYGEGEFYKVVTGAVLGSVVMIANYMALSLYISRTANNIIELRGNRDMTEEEIEKFTSENLSKIQRSVQLSFIIRTASMVLALVLAFLSRQFNLIATLIPLVAFRPLLTIEELFKRKRLASAPAESAIPHSEVGADDEICEAEEGAGDEICEAEESVSDGGDINESADKGGN